MNKELKLLLLIAASIITGLSALSLSKQVQGYKKTLTEDVAELSG